MLVFINFDIATKLINKLVQIKREAVGEKEN